MCAGSIPYNAKTETPLKFTILGFDRHAAVSRTTWDEASWAVCLHHDANGFMALLSSWLSPFLWSGEWSLACDHPCSSLGKASDFKCSWAHILGKIAKPLGAASL